jgi:hypothetical protein
MAPAARLPGVERPGERGGGGWLGWTGGEGKDLVAHALCFYRFPGRLDVPFYGP